MRSRIAIDARKYGIIHFMWATANAEATVQSIPIEMSLKRITMRAHRVAPGNE